MRNVLTLELRYILFFLIGTLITTTLTGEWLGVDKTSPSYTYGLIVGTTNTVFLVGLFISYLKRRQRNWPVKYDRIKGEN